MSKKEYHHAKHSKYLLKYHFVFCVKYRRKCLNHKEIDDEIKRLFIEIAEKSGFSIDVMESDQDHLHVLVDAPPTLSPTSIAARLKSQSTFHIWKKCDETLQWYFWKERTFWSDGYFVCSTGDASTETIKRYIEEQG
jgi:putative transposase